MSVPLCKDCVHFVREYRRTVYRCHRKAEETHCPITGRVRTEGALDPYRERRPVSRWDRFWGDKRCGEEGRHFAPIPRVLDVIVQPVAADPR